ncbi:MAG: 5-formyltetrahydrofolate cyclo-ligase [Microthrixaceae bacterium]|nr:5-formyltetrahydrofolate cyclo-ligase [Microthrixaceae bacterium]
MAWPSPDSPNSERDAQPTATDLRMTMRRRRRELDDAEQRSAAEAIAVHLLSDRRVSEARRVGVYLAFDGEVRLDQAIEALQRRGIEVAAAVLGDGRLRFASIGPDTPWRTNRYGIDEPDIPAALTLDGGELDVVVVPAVAVDLRGNRVGMGAGWYDRTFAGRSGESPLLVATVHDFQVVAGIASQPHDVAVDAIVTPTRWIDATLG